MGYNVIDMIDKLIVIEEKTIMMYRKIADCKDVTKPLKTTALVLAKEEERHIETFNNLKERVKVLEIDTIDFDVYDKISNLLFEFQSKIIAPKVDDSRSLLEFALDFERQNIALLLDIKGRLIKEKGDDEKYSYKTIESIIEEEEKHIENIKAFLR